MTADLLGPLMFVVVFLFIFLGYPVAFSLGGAALIFAVIGTQGGYFGWDYMALFPERVFGVMSNQVLLAIPFFIFMGTMLERSRLAEDLLRTIGLLFGPVRGGLALAVVFVGALLAAATGVVGASVVAMGMISLPIMRRYGYSEPLATGTIAASGTLGQIIPPSIVLVVLGDQLGVSVGKLFLGALTPGVGLALLFAAYLVLLARFRPKLAPALPPEEREAVKDLGKRVLFVLIPPLFLILVVLGSIFAGIATPTEAGALGAVGAMILAKLHSRLTRGTLDETMHETLRLTCMVVFLLVGSTAFALVFRGLNGDLWIETLLTNLPGGLIGFLIVANLAIFVLGFFIDFARIVAQPHIGTDGDFMSWASEEHMMIWFGVMIAMNLQTSFLTPPFGFSLFYLRGVTPKEIPTTAIYRGAVPFIAIQLVALAVVIAFPDVVTYLL